jgi:NAD(P)-dependent dehydrogenase (short-subunit alcohol dehydrogenase family)
MDPSGKVAVISGGASGIGFATAKLLSQRGARVVLADLQSELGAQASKAIEDAGGEARFHRTDVTSLDDVRALLDFATGEFGRVDIVHNNAGVSERGDFFAMSPEQWQRTVAVNLQAVIGATQVEVQHMRKQGGGGVIVNTASMGGLVPMATNPVYAATKAGVIHFTRSLAYLANESIRVNAVCPSFTDTPMVRQGTDSEVEASFKMMTAEVGGILKPENIAEGVLELVQDDARAGAILRVTIRGGIDYAHERRR